MRNWNILDWVWFVGAFLLSCAVIYNMVVVLERGY